MCVIAIMDGTRPTTEQVEQMYETNSSGAGIVWREETPKGTVVRWRKGLKLEEIQDLIKTVPLPAIAHFRIPTCGGDGPEMNHPFQVDVKSSLELSGSTKGYMLCHNGHWGQWKSTVLETAIKTGKQLPGGRWSDSRGMAWVAAIYGIGALELIDEKCAVLSPTNLEVFGNGWSKVTDGLWVSNKIWERGTTTYQYGRGHSHYQGPSTGKSQTQTATTGGDSKGNSGASNYSGTMCKERRCIKPKVMGMDYCEEHVSLGKTGGSSPEETFRNGSTGTQGGEAVEEKVQESQGQVCESDEADRSHEREAPKAESTVIDASTVAHSLSTEEDRVKAIEFVRSLNPSNFRRPLRDIQSSGNDDRLARLQANRQGIINFGKL